jgi:hypothetical protein
VTAWAYDAGMPNRRTFLLIVVVVVLMHPAEQVVHTWFRRQLAVNPEGSLMHGVGEVGTAVTP